MLSELLGELNASHTGARYAGGGSALSTATLGVFYDESYSGTGLKIRRQYDRQITPLLSVRNVSPNVCRAIHFVPHS